ncbi:MAG: hypothetical protein CMM87_03105 [Rickettsiales bacterium]|nr:hypothetical protein [Rickettsiales bacterium]|tara:strand:+ start:14547 stop:15770 length:1224 start_codon:yes stop_codon:yes gene_type:complete
MINKKHHVKPRAIFFIVKRYSLYPSLEVLIKVLEKVFDLTLCGPGYSTENKTYFHSPKDAFDRLGGFDAAFIDLGLYVLNKETALSDIRRYNNNFFPASVLKCKIAKNFSKDFNTLCCEKFLSLVGMDPYGCTEDVYKSILNFPGKLVAYPSYFMSPKKEVLALKKKEIFHDKVNFLYERVLNSRKKDVIPYAHALSDIEFNFKKKKFKYDISVPGCSYIRRKEMKSFLEEEGLFKFKGYYRVKNFLGAIDNKNQGSVLRKFHIMYMRFLHRQLISNGFSTYTDGSQLNYLVRKFLEIPAFGSILLAAPFYNHSKAGFIEGKHFIKTNRENIVDTITYLKKDYQYAQTIRQNSFEMVKEKHSETAWVNYFMKIWNLIVSKNYEEAFWDNENLQIRSQCAKKIFDKQV